MMELTKHCPTPEATEKLAADIAPYLLPSDVIGLEGYLGAGKSHFARALIRALGSKQKHLPSPTFTLIQIYDDTRMPVAHADFYRLSAPEEADELSLEPFLKHGLTLIEWPENAPHLIPENALRLCFDDDGHGRKITLKAPDSWAKRFGLFAAECRRASTEKGRLNYLESTTGKRGQLVTPVSDDASFRTYWRVRGEDGCRILMDAPPPIEDLPRFVEIGKFLESVGIHSPHVYHVDGKKGYAMIEDMGKHTFFDAMAEGADMRTLYEKAVDVLIHLANNTQGPVEHYTEAQFLDEASVFCDWYMPVTNGHATHTADRQQFRNIMAGFYQTVMAAPHTTMLKDYHCQNLMLLGDPKKVTNKSGKPEIIENIADVGVLDFQDAKIGPVTYDLASLLYDVRFDVPEYLHDVLIDRLLAGLDQKIDRPTFMTALRLIQLQNLLRIAGVFSRLAFRDGKKHYLNFMPRLWHHFDKLIAATPEAQPLVTFLNKKTPCNRDVKAV